MPPKKQSPRRKPPADVKEQGSLLGDVLAVRRVACALFDQIIFDGATLDRAFSDEVDFTALNQLDRALARMIVTTAIRRLGQIDDILNTCMDGKTPSPQELQTLLRLSVAQIIFMKIPDHAAVNIAVDLAKSIGLDRQKGLVNAVLRRVVREGKDVTTRQDIPRLNIPAWMRKDWEKQFGRRAAQAIAQASLTEAPLDLRARDPETQEKIAADVGGIVLPNGTIRIGDPRGTLEKWAGYTDGTWWVQDAAAALPVMLMGDLSGKKAIDLCAAPGGKTAQMAALGADVVALDRSSARLATLRQNLDRLHLADQVHVMAADASDWIPDDPADIVLLDAPCTATGTLRRNPDILHHRTDEDVLRMTGLQIRLLNNAARMVRPGGLLIYAVCSLQAREAEDQAGDFLRRHPDFDRIPVRAAEIGGWAELIDKNGDIRVLPTHFPDLGGMDGFFSVRFQRK